MSHQVTMRAGFSPDTEITDFPAAAKAQIEWAQKQVRQLHKGQRDRWLTKWAQDCIKHGYRKANTWLRERSERHAAARSVVAPYYPESLPNVAHDADSVAECAASQAEIIRNIIDNSPGGDSAPFEVLSQASAIAGRWDIVTGYEKAAEEGELQAALCALLKLQCEKFWTRKLRRLAGQYREHLRMALGHVGKAGQAYISGAGFNEWRTEQERQQAWIDIMQVRNEDTGDVIPLRDAYNAGMGNLSNRFAEMITRLKGLQALRDEAGDAALFVTLTCPSRFHRSSGKRWGGEGGRQSQLHLRETWARIRAALARADIEFSGVRVAEPHKDGCAHWHLLIWHKPERKDELQRIITEYALEVDGDEAGADEHRATFEAINPEKGDAVAYVIKYLAKNIDGNPNNPDMPDFESGLNASDGAARVRAWASRWRTRQFQFFGAASVTVWREVFKAGDSAAAAAGLSDVYTAIKNKRWADFQRAVAERSITPAYQLTEYGNDYAETTKTLKGLTAGTVTLITRAASWVIERAQPVSGGSAATWTRRNNCTGEDKKPDELTEHLTKFAGMGAESAAMLRRGCRVSDDTGRVWRIRGGMLLESDN